MKQLEPHVEKQSFLRKNWIVLLLGILALAGIGYYVISKQNAPTKTETAAVIYTCPMHPQIRSDKSGSCPICGMTLVPKRETAADKAAAIPGSVAISAAEAIKGNVRTVAIERRAFIKDIQSVGTIKIAEPGEHVISARTRGRIDKLYINATGKTIRKGEPLYEFYSPDLLNAEQEYLIVKNEHGVTVANSSEHMHGDMNEGLIAAGKERLKLYGLSDKQIADIEENGASGSTITVLATESGIVLQKLVQEGTYVDEGTPLFQLADLSVVWAEIQVPESDIRFVREGYSVSIAAAAYPAEKFQGRVIFISPVENPESRTITVRLELPNASRKLRPEMFVSASIHIDMGKSLAVPMSAVIQTGASAYVWVRNGDGSFSSRMITVGASSQDKYYQVLDGLTGDEEVAASGQFLIDSEHQFAEGANPMAGMKMDAGNEKSKSSGEGVGVVRSTDEKAQTITIDHGNIPDVMSAMTMAYKVGDPALLEKVRSGDHVKFTLTRSDNGAYLITSIATE